MGYPYPNFRLCAFLGLGLLPRWEEEPSVRSWLVWGFRFQGLGSIGLLGFKGLRV